MREQYTGGISELELAEIEHRSRAATLGPWISLVVGRDLEAGLNSIGTADCTSIEVLGATVADQDFIANAREDVPSLIEEVRRLRAQIKQQLQRISLHEGASLDVEAMGLQSEIA